MQDSLSVDKARDCESPGKASSRRWHRAWNDTWSPRRRGRSRTFWAEGTAQAESTVVRESTNLCGTRWQRQVAKWRDRGRGRIPGRGCGLSVIALGTHWNFWNREAGWKDGSHCTGENDSVVGEQAGRNVGSSCFAVWLWVRHWTSLSLNLLSCKSGIIMIAYRTARRIQWNQGCQMPGTEQKVQRLWLHVTVLFTSEAVSKNSLWYGIVFSSPLRPCPGLLPPTPV